MKNISLFLGRVVVPVFALAMIFSACDSSNGFEASDIESEDLDQTVAFLARDLGLTATETQALSGAFAGHEGQSHEPGFLWRVAADLQQRLTDEQKQRFFDRYDARRDAPGAGFGQRGHGQFGQGARGFGQQGQSPGHFGQSGGGQGFFGGAIALTDDQKEQIRAIREAYADEFKALVDGRRDGSITVEDFRTQMEALRETIRSEVEAVLTDEQKQQLEDLKAQREAERAEREAQREANREAARAVMIEVLGLSDDQVTALDDLHATREALHATIRDLIDGGADREEIMDALEAARADFEATLEDILDDTQLEIFKIHSVLAQRLKHRRMQQAMGHARFGGQGTRGQNGPGHGRQNGGFGAYGMGSGTGQHHGGSGG